MIVSFMTDGIGTHVLQASLSFTGATTGPVLGIFLLGALFPFANSTVSYLGTKNKIVPNCCQIETDSLIALSTHNILCCSFPKQDPSKSYFQSTVILILSFSTIERVDSLATLGLLLIIHDTDNDISLYFQGAIFGFLVSISFSLWLAIGTFITKPYSRTKLPTSTANCSSYLAHNNGYRYNIFNLSRMNNDRNCSYVTYEQFLHQNVAHKAHLQVLAMIPGR